MSSPFNDWAVYAHKDDTGLGRIDNDLHTVLGFGVHLVIPSERLVDHPLDGISEYWLPANASEESICALLTGLDGILFFERHAWHPQILRIARGMGVATVCVPMWEWFNGHAQEWQYFDMFACPSRFTERIVRSYGFTNTIQAFMRLPHRDVRPTVRLPKEVPLPHSITM